MGAPLMRSQTVGHRDTISKFSGEKKSSSKAEYPKIRGDQQFAIELLKN